MLPLKISKMKKRLSDETWTVPTILVAILCLLTILTYGFRVVTVESNYGIITAEIPVVRSGVEDPSFHRYSEAPSSLVSKFTPAVLLTTEAFYFGDLSAFTTSFSNSSDKYVLRHIDGEPQLFNLIESMQKWLDERAVISTIPKQNIIVVVPAGDIPVPIIMQVVAAFRKTSHFKRVILGAVLF